MADLQIQNPSITSGAFASMLAFSSDNYTITAISGHPIAGVGGGGTPVDGYWRPSVNTAGDISWAWSLESTSTVPSTANIKGPQGIQGETGPQGPSGTNGTDGKDGADGKDGYSVELQSVTDEDGGKKVTLSWGETPSTSSFVIPSGAKGADGQNGTDGTNGKDGISPTFTITPTAGGTHVTISGAQGEDGFDVLSGAKGADGQNGQDGAPGIDGISPTFTTSVTSDEQHPQGGTHVVLSGAAGESAFNVWNGMDGQGATVNLVEGDGIQITKNGTDYTIGVSADYLTAVSADSTLSGDGTSEHPLGIDMSSAYSIDGTHGITAIPNTADNKVIVQMTDDVWAYYQRLAASADVWDSASAIGNKSKTVINNSVNAITTENNGTSATISAVEYKVNTSFQNAAPKQLFVVQDDNDIYSKLSEVNGKGSLFFVCSAI